MFVFLFRQLRHPVMNPGTEDEISHSSDEMEAEVEPEVASRFGPSRFLPSGE